MANQQPLETLSSVASHSEAMNVDEDLPTYNLQNGNFFDILKHKYNNRHLLEIKKQMNNITDAAIRECKILKFGVDYSFMEILKILPKIELGRFKRMFVLIIEGQNFGSFGRDIGRELNKNVEKLIGILSPRLKSRPFLIQITSVNEQISKLIYKKADENIFNDISTNFNVDDFTAFICRFMNLKLIDLNENFADAILTSPASTLIIRFLQIYDPIQDFLHIIRAKCAEKGTKNQFLATLDDPFDNNGKMISFEMQKFICNCFTPDNSTSYLSIAIDHQNSEVFEYLVNYCQHLIQLLPFEHQQKIMTNAYNNQKYEENMNIICDLLEIADFPFPENIGISSINHANFVEIIKNREEFYNAILSEDYEKIKYFINNNLSLKIVYDLNKSSALHYAIENDKLNVYCFLKSYAYRSAKNENFESSFDNSKKLQITNWNANNSEPDEEKSVSLLTARSFVYNRKINKSTELEYRNKIKEWYKNIFKTKFGKKLLEVAAQCEDLKIIYDFDSDLVNEVDISVQYEASGTAHVYNKWIFIGAKSKSQNDDGENIIRGTIIHELCHYVINLVFENNAKPYYQRSRKIADLFEYIVKFYFRWSRSLFNVSDNNDECDGIVAAVYTSYDSNVHHQELIVRVPHMLAHFFSNDTKIQQLEQIYWFLFKFYEIFVVPALESFDLKLNDRVRKLNKILGNLQKLETLNIQLATSEIKNTVFASKNAVIATNNPKILLQDIKNCLLEFKGQLFDAESIFIAPKALSTKGIKDDIKDILTKAKNSFNFMRNNNNMIQSYCNLVNNQSVLTTSIGDSTIDPLQKLAEFNNSVGNLLTSLTTDPNVENSAKFNIIIDCSKESGDNLKFFNDLPTYQHANFIFVVPNTNQNLLQKLNIPEIEIKRVIIYNFTDLTPHTQLSLFGNNVNFQNNSTLSLGTLLSVPPHFIPQNIQSSQMSIQEPTISIFTSQYGPRNLKFIQTSEVENPENKKNGIDLKDYENIIDGELLRLLTDKAEIKINHTFDQVLGDVKHFSIIFQTRRFIKKYQKEERKTLSIKEYKALKGVKKFEEDPQYESEASKKDDTIKVIEIVQATKEMSIDDQLKEIKGKKFVLISDIAGTGKSWILRNVASKLHKMYPEKWMTFIDLKQFISAFNSHQGAFNFVNFMINKIIKPKASFEEKIFRKLYENGQVLIFCDGFDEISPDCAEIVTKFLQSFEQNYDNQLWVTTRDYFEIDLKDKLDLHTVYKLNEFSDDQGIEIMTTNWMLNKLENSDNWRNNQTLSDDELRIKLQSEPEYKNFKNQASNLIKMIPKTDIKKIGFPQFYRIISEILKKNDKDKDDRKATIEFTLYIIYKKYGHIQANLWCDIKREASAVLPDIGMGYPELHQYYSVKRYFPSKINFCDLEEMNIGWSDEHIVGFGFLSMQDGQFVFPHDTFCEFYAAEFILRIMRKGLWTKNDDFFEYFLHFTTTYTFNIVRMFINDGWNVKENLIALKTQNKIQAFASKFIEKVSGLEDFYYIFGEGLENLVEFLIQIFNLFSKSDNYSKVKNIIFRNIENIIKMSENSDIFMKIQDFYVDFLHDSDLKDLIEKRSLVYKTVDSSLNLDVFDQFLTKIQFKLENEFVQDKLKRNYSDNILVKIVLSENNQFQNFANLLDIFAKYLNRDEIWEMIKNKKHFNLLHLAMLSNDPKRLKKIWQAIYSFCTNTEFLELLEPTENRNENRTPLNDTAFRNNVDFHKVLWELLPSAFSNDKEKLKDYILIKDNNRNSFLHMLVSYGDPDVIKIIFKNLKIILSDSQYAEIIKSKGFKDRNLLQKAADISLNIESHRVLWDIVRDFCGSDDDFFNYLNESNEDDSNVLFTAANFLKKQVLEFMINYLEEMEFDRIKELLSQKTSYYRNILQSAMSLNKSQEMHEYLWKIVRKYFSAKEIYAMVTETDNPGLNLLELAHKFNNPLKEFTWNQIKEFIPENKHNSYLKSCYFVA